MTTQTPDKAEDKKPVPGTGHEGMTFLVGETVYLRTIERGDEKYATSWRNSIFPKAESLVESWIDDDLPKEGKEKRGHLLILRKADDVIVGSITTHQQDFNNALKARVDPLYGDEGQRWQAEALRLITDWGVNENHVVMASTTLPATDTIVMDALLAFGYVETARFREKLFLDGERVDQVLLQYFNEGWVETLGSPMDTPLERTGTGEPRPLPAKVQVGENPPKNAVMVGERVYLRPEEKADARQYVEWARKEEETFFDIGRHLPTHVTMENWLMEHQKPEFPEWIWFSVCLRETDELIGTVGILDMDWVSLTAETGSFFLGGPYRGQGYGSEAKQLLLEWCFETLGLHMVVSFVYFPNTRSAAALRKQGYREAGRYCWVYPYEGNLGNMVVFDLLAEEWRMLPRG